jgi:hypothetical protein
MRSPTRLLASAVVLLPLALTIGCEVEAGPPGGVAVVPGYYYDEEYVDVGGVHHPRDYWYHDGHRWAHRDAAPQGFVVHDRASLGYVHGAAPHGGGDGGGHGGR